MYHGIINVYKEAGYTSHDVVARLRGICKQKKIGHTGTLDPDAVGVLPVCLGNATRLCDMLTDKSKEYVAVLRLGIVTDTQDIWGKVLEERRADVEAERVRKVIMSFLGDSMQVPPMYSALKVNGKKLCDLARAGKEVERTPRPITIYRLEILKEEHPDYTIRVECSKGTYIRTLCHDIGQCLGCGGVMKRLERTRVGEFGIAGSRRLKELEELSLSGELERVLVPVDCMFSKLPGLAVRESAALALRNGNQLRTEDFQAEGFRDRLCGDVQDMEGSRPDGRRESEASLKFPDGQELRVYDQEGRFCGVYRYAQERGIFSPVKMFLPEQGK